MNSFNKFFENSNEEIILETKEANEDADITIDDDTIYEIDLYNNLLGDLPLFMQNNPKIQVEYLKMARHLINLKNKAKEENLEDICDYPDMKKIYNNEFNVSWVIPVVLDKKKIYKKLDINNENENTVMEQYVEIASESGIQYEQFLDELKKEIQYIDEFQRDKLSYPSFKKLVFDIENPYIIKKDLNKKDVGYQFYLNNSVNLFRYFNNDNKFWQTYMGMGPEKFSYEQYDDEGKRIGSKTAQILSGEYVNIVGFLVFGSEKETILDLLNGEPWCDKIRMIGEATAIKKNDKAIVVMKNHGLKNGDNVMIEASNSSPSIDGEYNNIKIINSDEFMIPVNITEGIEGTFCKIYTTTTLKFDKIEIKKGENYGDKYNSNSYLYLFPEENITDLEWKEIVKNVIPTASSIINNKIPLLEKMETIEDMNNILKSFSIEFKNLGYNDYFILSEILESKYIDDKKRIINFNYENYYEEIMKMRDEIIEKNKETGKSIADDIIFGDKYILNSEIVKYYGKYPNYKTDVDTIASRYNWLLHTPDYGKTYFLIMEMDKINGITDKDIGKKEIQDRLNDVIKEIELSEKEINKNTSSSKICTDRKINPVKIYESFNDLIKDFGKISEFNDGDFAIIENKKDSNEDGMIYIWNGMNWMQHPLIQNIDDLCLLGVEKIKDFNIEKLHCLFKEACKNKKFVRTEKKIDRLKNEEKILSELLKSDNTQLEKKIKNDIYIAELGLQIYLREKETTKKKETIEMYEQDIDPLYLKINKIPDLQNQEYLRNLLIKKDGIMIDKDIFSIRTGKKICCGHYYYQLKIASGNSPSYSEKVTQEMLAIFGSEEENGIIFCNHDGRPLMLMEYDTSEGLSRTTGEISKQRETIISEEEEFKAEILADKDSEKEINMLDCSSSEIRNELLKMGFDVNQIPKAKEICVKLNTLNSKTGILLKKKDFINIIIDILQLLQKMIDFTKFKQVELIKYKQQGIDLKQVKIKTIQERYNNLIIIRKITLIAARLLITYQTIIPPQFPSGKKTRVVFEDFNSDKGIEYMALLIEEAKILPIQRESKTGEAFIQYLQMGKIKEEVWKSYNDLSELSNIKQMKIDRKLYDKKFIKEDERNANIKVRNIPVYPELSKKFQSEVEKLKSYKEFMDYQKKLYERQAYIGEYIITKINESIQKSGDYERDDPKGKELSCCFEPININTDYYSNIHIDEILDELKENGYYYGLFLNSGILVKHYPERKKYFTVNIDNLGYNPKDVRRKLFITYIDTGIFKGEKHEYNEDGMCLLTGNTKQDISKKEYTNDEENDLIKAVIDKTTKKIIFGGTKEDELDMKNRDNKLIDDFDYEKIKNESEKMIYKDIGIFVDKMGKLLNKNKNQEYMINFREKLETLGLHNKILELDRIRLELDPNVKSSEIINFENEKNRMKIYHLKQYINNYFRRYLSMIQNKFDPTEHIKKLDYIDEYISKELQKYIYEREHFLKKYLTKRDSELFKKLKFDVNAKVINNITADIDKWDITYSKVDKVVNYNLSHLSNSLMYILIKNLDKFISDNSNPIIAQFIMDIFEIIFKDNDNLDHTKDTFILGDYRTQESKVDEEEVEEKSDAVRMIDELSYKFKKISKKVYEESDKQDEVLSLKDKFIKKYKEKHEKDPTDTEVIDYLEEQENEKEVDEDEDKDEFIMKEDAGSDEELEKGVGYGEMPQGGEGGEDGDY